MSDIFISYSSEDKKSAEEICRLLEDEGMECWIAPRDVTPGKPFGEEIISAIENASVMVLVLSGSANVSGFVMREVERAIANRKVVIPFRIQDVKPAKALELFIAGSQWIDAWVPPLETKVKLLASTIRRLIGSPVMEESRKETQLPELTLPVQHFAISTESTTEESSSTLRPSDVPVPAQQRVSDLPVPASPLGTVLDEEGRDVINRALAEFIIEISNYGTVTDKNSVAVWRRLYATCKADAIIGLCDILKEGQHDWQVHWKAITLLNYGLRTTEGKALGAHVLGVVRDYTTSNDPLKNAAFKLISEAPVSPREKWNHLFTLLQTVQSNATGAILNQLPQFTPPDERVRTASTILDILTYSTDSDTVRCSISALKALNYRQSIPQLREILQTSPLDKAVALAGLLSEWQDHESIPIIRAVIENWRYGSNTNFCELLASLYGLEKSVCTEYIGEVLLEALPVVQRYLVQSTLKYGGLRTVTEKPLLDAVSELARTTDDPDIKKEAEAFLAKA